MLTRTAIGLALVLAAASGSLAATNAHKGASQSTYDLAPVAGTPSESTVYGWPAKDLHIFRR